MDFSGTIPDGAIADPDLRDVALRPGPVVSVVLALEPATDHAAHHDTTAWHSARRQLADQGAPDVVLDAIEALVPDAHTHGAALLAIAGEDGVRLVRYATHPPRRQLARWSALADLGPMIVRRQSELAHLVVVVDHAGADIVLDRGHGPLELDRAGGADGPVARTTSGGDRADRNQRRVDQTWKSNASAAATAVGELASSIDAKVIVASGDPRSLPMLRDHLAPAQAAILEVVGGSVSAGGDRNESDEVRRTVATVAARHTVAILEAWRSHLGTHGRATEGAAATLDALRQGAVEILLVHDDIDDDRQAWVGPSAEHIGLSKDELAAMGVDGPDAVAGRLVDAAVRTALGTGAAVAVVPAHGGPLEGLGAILRWSNPD